MKGVKQKSDWRTSSAAIGSVLSALGVIITALAKGQYDIAIPAIPGLITAVGLLFARDSSNSDQDVGVR